MSQVTRSPQLDVAYVARWTPARFAVVGIMLYGVVILLSPLEYNYSLINVGGALYMAAVLIGFFVGCRIASTMGRWSGAATPQPIGISPDRFIDIAAMIGTVGVLARVYDRFVLRGFSVEQTYSETRETLEKTVSVFGYIGGLFFTFGMIALVLMWLSSSQSRRPFMFVYVALLALFPTFESLLQGSRSTMIYTAFLLFFFARSSNAMNWIVKSRFGLAAAGILLVALIQLIFEVRSLQDVTEAVDISEIYRAQSIAAYARPPDWVTEAINATGGRGLTTTILKSWVHIAQYMTHSWLVFFVNFDAFGDVHGWGRWHLNMFTRFLTAITGENLNYDPAFYGLQDGIFGTAISAIYYDFGAFGPLMSGLFGFAATVIHRKTILYPERWLPLNFLLCFACVTMLVESALLSGVGAFAIWSFLAYTFLHYIVTVLTETGDPEVSIAPTDEPSPPRDGSALPSPPYRA